MDYLDDKSFSHKNKHLRSFEKGQIAWLHNQGASAYTIVKKLGELKKQLLTNEKKVLLSKFVT